MNDSGIVIKLKDEIEGLIPMNKISKDQKKNIVSDLNEGDTLDLLVVEVKPEDKSYNKRICNSFELCCINRQH